MEFGDSLRAAKDWEGQKLIITYGANSFLIYAMKRHVYGNGLKSFPDSGF